MAEREEPRSPRPSGENPPGEPPRTPPNEEHDRRLMSRVTEMLGQRRRRRRRFRREEDDEGPQPR